MKEAADIDSLIGKMIDEAVHCLSQEGVVAFPTESYYGLGVNPFSAKAVEKLFAIKQREKEKAILLLIAEEDMLDGLVMHIPDAYRELMKHFWPGPLTLLFPAAKTVSTRIKGNTEDIGIRVSSNPIARELCRKWQRPVTATSANISGTLPARTSDEIAQIFGKNVDFVVDGGYLNAPSASTIIGYKKGRLIFVREGLIPYEDILAIF